jgi:hypothetical protein
MRPTTLVHCDWSIHAAKRWRSVARLQADGTYAVADPQPAGPLDTFFATLRAGDPDGRIAAGFDFPIGVPRLYANKAGVSRFPYVLPRFGESGWEHFYEVAEKDSQISSQRPFYPRKPGGTKQRHLIQALGLDSYADLLRRCDQRTADRRQACAMFWTLGPNQVGRAALAGWRELLVPAIRRQEVVLWPFDGDLVELQEAGGRILVVETYPAEFYGHLGMERNFKKSARADRQRQAKPILSWCEANRASLSPGLRRAVEDGFGEHKTADDVFDTVTGLLGMIEVFSNPSAFPVPEDPEVRAIEGWILGMRESATKPVPLG